jgi:SagB-type dehydrogenase family enzyme
LVNDDVQKGLYHYDPLSHSLDVLLVPLKYGDTSKIWKTQQWFKKASIVLILTAVYTRTTEKYGEKGLPFPFIEAGHIGQNIYLLAQSMKIGCCAIGQFNEKPLCELLDINIFEEYPIYYIALGN